MPIQNYMMQPKPITKTNGEKKQALLTKYEEAIDKYMKILGGKTDDNENQ